MKNFFLSALMSFFMSVSILMLMACTTENYAPVNGAKLSNANLPNKYRVQKGETLYAIAWHYNMDYRTLAEINHLSSPYLVKAGQVISLKQLPSQPETFKPVHIQPVPEFKPIQKTVVVTQTPVKSEIKAETFSENNNQKIQWRWPAKGRIVARYSPSAGQKGVDIAGTLGEPIYAAASGKIAYSGDGLRGYGNLIIIKHNAEFLSAYAHNQKLLVHEGETVKAGQMIATMGNTESKVVMLHFEIREAGKSVDPLIYVKP